MFYFKFDSKMKKLLTFSVLCLLIGFYSCDENTQSSSNQPNEVTFQGNSYATRSVELRSRSGGISYGYATFSESSMMVTLSNGTRLYAVKSDNSMWNYMVPFENGDHVYFD